MQQLSRPLHQFYSAWRKNLISEPTIHKGPEYENYQRYIDVLGKTSLAKGYVH